METTTVCTKVKMDTLRSRSLSADEKWSALCEWAGLGARTASSHNVADVIQAMTSKAMSRSVAEKLERRAKAGQPGRFVIKNKRAYLQVVSIYEGSSNVLAMPPGDPAVRPVLAWTPFRKLAAEFHDDGTQSRVWVPVVTAEGTIYNASWLVSVEKATEFIRLMGGRLVFVRDRQTPSSTATISVIGGGGGGGLKCLRCGDKRAVMPDGVDPRLGAWDWQPCPDCTVPARRKRAV